jgi:hypothetical protein
VQAAQVNAEQSAKQVELLKSKLDELSAQNAELDKSTGVLRQQLEESRRQQASGAPTNVAPTTSPSAPVMNK